MRAFRLPAGVPRHLLAAPWFPLRPLLEIRVVAVLKRVLDAGQQFVVRLVPSKDGSALCQPHVVNGSRRTEGST